MSTLPSNSSISSIALPFPGAAPAERAIKPARTTPLAEEVMGLFNELRNPLLRYLLGFGLSVPDAEEVAQEVFLALFQHLQRGKSRSNLRGWIFRVGHNLALKQRIRNARLSPLAADPQLDCDPNPEEQLGHKQRQEQLLNIVRKLPELDRCCLNLRAEGLRYREIAKTLGISLGGVSLSLARSIASLARLMHAE